MNSLHTLLAALLAAVAPVAAQSCSKLTPARDIKPSIASGYAWQLVATGLASPRGIAFDPAGNLLVVEKNKGLVSALTLAEQDGCMTVVSTSNITGNMSLNHGIAMGSDNTLYVSSTEAAYGMAYTAQNKTAGDAWTIVTNMTTEDHTTRTLLLSQKSPGKLLISRGSTSNLDIQAADISTGHSQIKAFDLGNYTRGSALDFDSAGQLLGWGLRNDVGMAEHPRSGGIYAVENSADQVMRRGLDVHQNNPAEKLNFLGYLNGTASANQGSNFGYPWCFAAWQPSELPDSADLHVGSQFAVDASSDLDNMNKTDEYCAAQTPARLVFQAHQAPLDIKFNNSGAEAWIAFHGSWDRDDPTGYTVGVVAFNADGDPVDAPDSTTAQRNIFSNQDNSKCPDACFRPVAMAFDAQGRLFVSSDATGEIYMITKTDAAAANGSSSGNTGSGSGSGSGSGNNTSTGASMQMPSVLRYVYSGGWGLAITALAIVFASVL